MYVWIVTKKNLLKNKVVLLDSITSMDASSSKTI